MWIRDSLCRVEDRSSATLLPLRVANIEPGSIRMSDEWRSYRQIVNLPQQYSHLTVNHSYNFVDPQTGAHTQGVESMWRSCKCWNMIECGTRRECLDSYLSEFMWRSAEVQNIFPGDVSRSVPHDVESPPYHLSLIHICRYVILTY